MNTTFSTYEQQTIEDTRKMKIEGFSKKKNQIRELKGKVKELELLGENLKKENEILKKKKKKSLQI